MPGERITYSVSIDNASSREINPVKVSLVEFITFHATTKSKTSSRTLAIISNQKRINSKQNYLWNDASFVIPPVCSSSNGLCRIIDIKYFVALQIDPSGMAFNLNLNIPVTIGMSFSKGFFYLLL